jgi:glycosyl transferase family 25
LASHGPPSDSIPVYVLNLAQSPERLTHMRSELGKIGVAFRRIEAVAAGDVERHPDYARIPLQALRPWTKGELGCLLSHSEAWRRIAAGRSPFGAVLEDDLHVHPSLNTGLRVSLLPADADLVKLETTNVIVQTSRGLLFSWRPIRFRRLNSLHHGSGAYVISRGCAARALAALSTFALPVDDCLFGGVGTFGDDLRRYQQVPASVVQDCILPEQRRTKGLGSILEGERHIAIERRAPNRSAGLIAEIAVLGGRIPAAVWRRLAWRYARIPWAGGALDE